MVRRMVVSLRALALVIGVSLAGAASALAVPMSFDLVGVTDPTVTAHVVFAYNPGTATIEIDITNTAGGLDPRLTAFAFNVPSSVTGVTGFSGPPNWDDSYSSNGINTPGQFGFYDIAGLTGPNFMGGDPNDGIPSGSTAHFEFVLAGTGLNLLDESSFLGLLSFDPAGMPDEDEQYFIARFQRTGSTGSGSDVAIPTGEPVPVPEPTTLLLLGGGLVGLTVRRRTRRA